MAEKNAMLVMRDVSKTFNPGTVNEKCALKNLNLTLKPVSYTHLNIRKRAGNRGFWKKIR